jgi:hypothetical protein
VWCAAAEFHDFQTALNIADRVRDDLAVFGGQHLRERLHFVLNELKKLEQHPRAPLRIGRGPFDLRSLGVFHSLRQLGS